MKVVSATEAARTFSELINKVRYLGETIEIQRGRDIVARLVPPGPPKIISMSEMNDFFSSLPHLDSDDGDAFAADLAKIRQEPLSPGDPWE
jgi:antitoxin (DNA-binding transcriptional repressor) of toxin-antitoxin stability system